MSGPVVHFEIPADDLPRAESFYREAFGWKITSMPEMKYTMLQTAAADQTGRPTEPGTINGGMLARQGPVTHPVVTIQVPDIGAALQKVEQLGGKALTGRQDVGGMGFAAYFADTEGNVIGLWQVAG